LIKKMDAAYFTETKHISLIPAGLKPPPKRYLLNEVGA